MSGWDQETPAVGLEIGDMVATTLTTRTDGKRLLPAGMVVDAINYPLANALVPYSTKYIRSLTMPSSSTYNYNHSDPLGRMYMVTSVQGASLDRWDAAVGITPISLVSGGGFLDGGFLDAAFSDDGQYIYLIYRDITGDYIGLASSSDFGATFVITRPLVAAAGITGAPDASTLHTAITCSPDGQVVRIINNGNPAGKVYILESVDAGATWAAVYTSTLTYGLLRSSSATWSSNKNTISKAVIMCGPSLTNVSYPRLVITEVGGVYTEHDISLNNPATIIGVTARVVLSHDGSRIIYSDRDARSMTYQYSNENHIMYYSDDYAATAWTKVEIDFSSLNTDSAFYLQFTHYVASLLDSNIIYAAIEIKRYSEVLTTSFNKTIIVMIDITTGEWEYIDTFGHKTSTVAQINTDAEMKVSNSVIPNSEYLTMNNKNAQVCVSYLFTRDKFVPKTPNNSKLIVDPI